VRGRRWKRARSNVGWRSGVLRHSIPDIVSQKNDFGETSCGVPLLWASRRLDGEIPINERSGSLPRALARERLALPRTTDCIPLLRRGAICSSMNRSFITRQRYCTFELLFAMPREMLWGVFPLCTGGWTPSWFIGGGKLFAEGAESHRHRIFALRFADACRQRSKSPVPFRAPNPLCSEPTSPWLLGSRSRRF
jgi:hypothetical protein